MITVITVVHVLTILLLVIAVLLQSGKGAEISATFGGSSQTVFGSSGGQNFFQKLTYTLAAIFGATSLALTLVPSKMKRSVMEGYTPPAATVPAETTIPSGNAPSASAPANAPSATAPATTAPVTPAEKK